MQANTGPRFEFGVNEAEGTETVEANGAAFVWVVDTNTCELPALSEGELQAISESAFKVAKLVAPAGLTDVNEYPGIKSCKTSPPGESTLPVFDTVTIMRASAGPSGIACDTWRASTPLR
jgi:hypothetical protein